MGQTSNKKTRSKVEIPDFAKHQLVSIGVRVKQLREEKTGDSYEVFAVKNGINRISQYRMEAGSNFQMVNLLKVCKGLGVSLEDFFKGL
ncbi:helix-turn-helix domain-containing protein [Marivirga harenae]|uniref:helix-turn-helix domain-containing protein n=1 Tax=Marivirga harenae TaxID=2010992 RepID=UPI0026E00148|nr:helix-turn-helix domain-containing protein [Marivirga harenae]WKV12197.1 helix-turn-helix domain-containing protein [Marivirga harenae]